MTEPNAQSRPDGYDITTGKVWSKSVLPEHLRDIVNAGLHAISEIRRCNDDIETLSEEAAQWEEELQPLLDVDKHIMDWIEKNPKGVKYDEITDVRATMKHYLNYREEY